MADRSDRHHEAAVDLARRIAAAKIQVLTSDYVVAETYSLIMYKLGHAAARTWLSRLDLQIEFGNDADLDAAKLLLAAHRSMDLSLTDALSMAIMRRTGTDEVLGFDRHFSAVGFKLCVV
jgi:predicted nucleic acid-binding protein